MCQVGAGATVRIEASLDGGKASEHSRGFALEKTGTRPKKKKKNQPNPNPDYSEYFRLVEIIILKINNKIIKLAHFTTALSSGGTSSSALLAGAAAS